MAISQLEAVNYSLVYAGEAPVNSLTGNDQGVDTSTALFLLDQVTNEWQERGLDENVYTYTFAADAVTGEIVLPATTIDAYIRDTLLNLDTAAAQVPVDAQVRDGKLWNNTNRTYNWRSPYDYTTNLDMGLFTITIKEQLAWTELNQTSQRAIMHETARRYQTVTQNDPAVIQALAQESMQARARGRSNDIMNKTRGLFWNGDPNRRAAVTRRFGLTGNDAYWTRNGFREGY
jgi:hypothetical protein